MGTAYILSNVLILLVVAMGTVLLTALFSDLKAYSPKMNDPASWWPKLKLPYLYAEAAIYLTVFLAWLGVLYVIYRGEANLSYFAQDAVIWLVIANPAAQARGLGATKIVKAGITLITLILLLLYGASLIRGA